MGKGSVRQRVTLVINNTGNCTANISVGNTITAAINATKKYSWDTFGEDFSCLYGYIVINGKSVYFTFAEPTAISVAEALNMLGYGYFCTEPDTGHIHLTAYDDTNVYGDITFCGAAP